MREGGKEERGMREGEVNKGEGGGTRKRGVRGMREGGMKEKEEVCCNVPVEV